jgi:hypothetical protein
MYCTLGKEARKVGPGTLKPRRNNGTLTMQTMFRCSHASAGVAKPALKSRVDAVARIHAALPYAVQSSLVASGRLFSMRTVNWTQAAGGLLVSQQGEAKQSAARSGPRHSETCDTRLGVAVVLQQ